MADLSQSKPRITQQERITNNRSGVLPGRRNTEAPDLERYATMRSAARGDGGAEQLMQLFGNVNKAAQGFAQYAGLRQGERDKRNASEGALDATTGDFDPELAEKSRVYRDTYTRGRAEKDVLTYVTDLETKVQDRLNNRDEPADQDDIEELIHGSFKDYLKPNGLDRDFGSDAARDVVIGHLRQAQEQLRANATRVIQEQVREESLTNATEAFRLKLPMTEPGSLATTFEGAMADILPGVDRKKAKEGLITSTLNYVAGIEKDQPLRAKQIVAALRGSTRNPGEVQIIDPNTALAGPAAPAAATKAAPAASGGKLTATGNAGGLAKGLQAQGLPDVVVAGFLGNAEHESSFDSSRVGDKHLKDNAFGHLQWRADRVENFKRVTGVHPKGASPAQSAKFIKWELDNPGKAGMTVKQRDRILSARTPEEAARFIDQFFERSNGKSRKERETAARKYFGGGTYAGGDPVAASAIPQVEANYSREPLSVLEQADAGEEVLTTYSRDAMLSPDDRARIGDFERGMVARIEANETRAEAQRHDENAGLLIDRFGGIGDYPTITELQQARLRNEISPQAFSSFTRIIQGDEETRLARLDAANREADAEAAAADKATREARIQAVLAPVYSKGRSISATNAEVLRIAATITDPEERSEFIGGVQRELGAVGEMRQRTPAYTRTMTDFDALEAKFLRDLPRNLRGARREKAIARIKQSVDAFRVEVGRRASDVGYDPATDFRTAEQKLTDSYINDYHR